MSKRGHRPQRTCLGCGARDDQDRLIRVALEVTGKLILEETRGRGGYLHRKRVCWQAFVKRKGIYRAFRVELSRAVKEQLVEDLFHRDRE